MSARDLQVKAKDSKSADLVTCSSIIMRTTTGSFIDTGESIMISGERLPIIIRACGDGLQWSVSEYELDDWPGVREC